jgi:hypothetical protein
MSNVIFDIKNNINKHDDVENKYLNLLITNHSDLLNDIVKTYFSNNNEKILTYFRIYFMFYLITTYVYKPEINISQIKNIFFKWINKTLINKHKHTIIHNLKHHYNYLFKIFFVDKNIYFHVYFNNLIKYFLPLPFELNIYSPIITYRSGVNTFYKKNNIDYLDKPNVYDTKNKYHLSYNINEIDIHIPIKYFNQDIFKNIDIIYLIGKKKLLYICDSNKKILYTRDINLTFDVTKYLDKFLKKVSFEEMFPLWIKQIKTEFVDFTDALYISVMKKFSNRDLFNVFAKYEITKDKYKYLFHNTQLTNEIINSKENLQKSTFFYLIPLSKSKYFKSEPDRKCLMFKIDNNITHLLDLTTSIITNNNFTNHMIKHDRINKKWISYDPSKTLNYYKDGSIPVKFDENFKCLTTTNSDINNRQYCDISEYAGRRKLQEILFKTRKFRYKAIFLELEINIDLLPYEKYRLYHPPNVPISFTWDYDKYILQLLNSNGFFFIDYGDAIDGGELLLINPHKYIHLVKKSNKPCNDINAFPDI